MYRLLRYSLIARNITYLPTSRQFVLSYSSSAVNGEGFNKLGSSSGIKINGDVSNKLGSSSGIKVNGEVSSKPGSSSDIKVNGEVSNNPDSSSTIKISEMDEFLTNCVYKNKRSTFKLFREIEIKNMENRLNLEIAKKDKMESLLSLEIAKKDKDLAVAAIKTGHLNLNYLRLKGSVHLRGVFEQWELLNLSNFDGNRGTKWTKYLEKNEDVLESFQKFWPNPTEIDTKRVVTEIKSFYKWLSERIHNAYSVGDYIEWRRNALSPVQNKLAEYMCQDLNVEYRVVEPIEEEIE
ncbi:hypothetical protein C1645_815488 [Glomus cerebriforme]|uniref:Uncharacterized protein n=1 Tax=Glomus cerebriforme TaxID=658196 RepID=A0A397TEG4_9GLOM|nr:hypothetical protein C1645_815488 [Glomus cerebriforme]